MVYAYLHFQVSFHCPAGPKRSKTGGGNEANCPECWPYLSLVPRPHGNEMSWNSLGWGLTSVGGKLKSTRGVHDSLLRDGRPAMGK